MDKSYKEAIQRLAGEYISKVGYCDECFAESFCDEQQRRKSRLPCKDIMKCVSSISDYLHSIYYTKAIRGE